MNVLPLTIIVRLKRKYKLTEKFNTEKVGCFQSMFASDITLNFHTYFLDIGLM